MRKSFMLTEEEFGNLIMASKKALVFVHNKKAIVIPKQRAVNAIWEYIAQKHSVDVRCINRKGAQHRLQFFISEFPNV